MAEDDVYQNDTDQKREKRVYQYLLSFTDLGLGEGENISELSSLGYEKIAADNRKLPNESLIASQWSYPGKDVAGISRVYVRRVLRWVYRETLYTKSEHDKWSWPGLSMAKLVAILSSLETYWKDPQKNKDKRQPPKVTHSVKLKAIEMFSELSSKERELLNFSMPSGEDLIRRIYEDVLNPSYKFRYEELAKIYQQYLTSKTTYYNENIPTESKSEIRKIISGYLDELISEDLSRDEGLQNRILREINRIDFQSGSEQLKNISNSFSEEKQVTSIRRKMFAQRLTKCIVENEEITDEFPICIKFFEIEKMRPLPLFEYDNTNNRKGLINRDLLGKKMEISGLERQYSYKLGLHFSIRYDNEYSKLDFFEEIVGIGSPISHAMIAIDRVLMWDIPCLREYFPIARQLFSNYEIINTNYNSPVLSHCVVQLYRKDDIKIAIDKSTSLEKIDENSFSHYGEYCGFDISESSMKSALYARLRAIQHVLERNNITSDEYIKQLCNRVNEYNNLARAKNLLKYYPFSLKVMESEINSKIFLNGKKYRNQDFLGNQDFHDLQDGKCWSSVAYDAHLQITEALLKEGRTVAAKKYLSALREHKDRDYLSSLMLARYHVCYSQYHLYSDLDSIYNDHADRSASISACEKCLELAENSLERRIKECKLLGQLSHSNTHPFFEIYSKISLVRARLYLYFPSYTIPSDNSIWGKMKAPLIEAEKARIYSARDGNASLYFSQSCFEAWVYLILAFTWDFEREPKDKEGFSKNSCIDWATRLLAHAVICYEKIGLKCYAEIKRNAGFSVANLKDRYDSNISIQGIPFIQEKASDDNQENNSPRVLYLDLNLFKTNKANVKPEDPLRPIFFGTDSSNIMFTDGIIELCKSPEAIEGSLSTKDNILFENILSAMRKFVIAWSTSRDGAYLDQEEGKYTIQEIFDKLPDNWKEYDTEILEKIDKKNNDRHIRGFYPHRISKTAVFSKLFIGVCLLIMSCKKEESKLAGFDGEVSYAEICKFIQGLHEEDIPENVPDSIQQKRFNGHLAKHVENIIKYFESFENWSKSDRCKSLNSLQVRDKVIKDIFMLVRGETINI
jgi:hypothetical protein